MLIAYAALMSISGAIFFATSNYIALIAAVFIGTINVTGTETGAFLSIKQAILPQIINDAKKRNTVYALYNMVGTFAMSAGILASGLPSILEHEYGLNQIDSIRLLFVLYSSLGLGVLGIYFSLSKKIEVEEGNKIPKPLKQSLSPKSKEAVGKLSGLFAIDSFAGGFVIQSIVSFWFFKVWSRFNNNILHILSQEFLLLSPSS
jgi:MFS family permease